MILSSEVGRRRVRITALLATVPLAAFGALAAATSANASAPPDHKVTICHRTGSEAGGNAHNGYSIITVDVASILNGAGHDDHDQVGAGPDGDIIPAFEYGGVVYPGRNGGQAAINNGCVAYGGSGS